MSYNFLGKTYILKKSENFDGYMKELGVGAILRKMGNTVTTQCRLSKNDDDDSYTFTLVNPYRGSIIRFQLGKAFKEVTLDSREVRTTCHLNGNIFVQQQSGHGLKSTKIVREYKGDEMFATLIVGNVNALRVYGVLEEAE